MEMSAKERRSSFFMHPVGQVHGREILRGGDVTPVICGANPTALRSTNRSDIVMLENLDRVNWKRARHAYGSAKDVPGLLRGLASEDESVRGDALYQLYGNIFHQGTRSEAAALAVPFLFELVLDPATRDRENLVFFLVALAFGYESEFLPFCLTPAEEPQRWGPRARAAYDAVAEGVASLAPLLRDTEPLRLAAAYALGHFPKHAAETAGDVRTAYEASTDETTRATLLIALAMVSLHAADKGDAVSLFRRIHGGDNAILRASAAAGLALLGAADDYVARTISATIIDASADNTKIPWNDGDFDGYLAEVLPLTASGREAAIAATLIDALADAKRHAKFTITRALLAVVVPSAGYRALSDLQRRALHAIEEHGQWDVNGASVVNFALMSNEYGLPDDRDDFRSFIEAAEASARGETVDWKPRERPRPSRRVDPEAPAYFIVLFGVLLLLWLLVAVNQPDLLPSTPRGWGLLSCALLGLGVSIYFLRRQSSVR
jgi:hypothetical protein